MKAGYARVSTTDQRLDVQLERLEREGCEHIYSEKISGTTASRPKLQECLDWVRKGDVLVVTRLDRLARSITDLCAISVRLKAKGVELKVLEQDVDTSTPTGKLMFGLLGLIAEFETELRAERQREGIAKARQRGVHLGRKAKLSGELVEQLRRDRQEGVLIKDLCRVYGLTAASVYRYLREDEVAD